MPTQLTQEEYNQLVAKGYNQQEIDSAVNQIDVEKRTGVTPQTQHSAFVTAPNDDLIKWQLELNDILERAEHILRGDIPTYTDGRLIWAKNPHPERNALNEEGVQEVLKILAMYVNRNTILSDYENEEIKWKVFDFGRRLNDFFFMRYDEMGMDTEDKRKNYSMIVGLMVDLVHSAYKRAWRGGERRSLREMISIQQSQQTVGTPSQMGNPMIPRERSVLNPARILKGKYY